MEARAPKTVQDRRWTGIAVNGIFSIEWDGERAQKRGPSPNIMFYVQRRKDALRHAEDAGRGVKPVEPVTSRGRERRRGKGAREFRMANIKRAAGISRRPPPCAIFTIPAVGPPQPFNLDGLSSCYSR